MQVKLGVRAALDEVVRAYRQNAATLLTVAALVFVPILLLTEIVGADNRDAAAGLFLALSGSATFLYAGIVAPLVEGPASPVERRSIGSLWGEAAATAPTLLLAGVIYTLGTTVGTMLLIVPGLVLATFWAVTPAAVRLESLGAPAALARSWSLVRGTAWRVFAVVLTVLVAAFVISTAIAALVLIIAGEETATFVGSWLGVVVAAPLIGILPTVLHRRLCEYHAAGETREEGVGGRIEPPDTDEVEGGGRLE